MLGSLEGARKGTKTPGRQIKVSRSSVVNNKCYTTTINKLKFSRKEQEIRDESPSKTRDSPVQLRYSLRGQAANENRGCKRPNCLNRPRLTVDRMYFTNPDSSLAMKHDLQTDLERERVFQLLWSLRCLQLFSLGRSPSSAYWWCVSVCYC